MWKEKAKRKKEGSKESREGRERRNIEKIDTQKVLEVEEGIQKKKVGKNASAKDLGPHYRIERRIYTEKEKDVLIVEGRKGRSASIYGGSVEKRIHPTFQVTPNITSTLCGKKE